MTFTGRLRKNFAHVLALPLGLVALQSAQAVAQVALARLGLDDVCPALSPGAPRRPRAAPFHSTSAAAILGRNPFDSEAGPFGRETAGPAPVDPSSSDPMSAPPCDRVRVLAIAASSDEPDWSLAALVDGADPRALIRRREGMVGALRVEMIGWDRVWLSGSRGLCQAAMFAPRSEPVARTLANPQPVVTSSGPPLAQWISQGIETISPTEHAIDRGLVPRILEAQADLLRGVQVVPEQVGGKIVGARLNGVRADSLLGKLGLVSGDRLETINGYELTSTQAAMEAYAQLQRADRLTLQVNRGGSEVRLELDIR